VDFNLNKVIDLATASVSFRRRRGRYREKGDCRHLAIIVDADGWTVECQKCKAHVSAAWWIAEYLQEIVAAADIVKDDRTRLREEEGKSLVHRAALALQKAWRSRTSVPTCPHCAKVITPEDKFGTQYLPRNRRRAPKGGPHPHEGA